jgi:hypothetical protein
MKSAIQSKSNIGETIQLEYSCGKRLDARQVDGVSFCSFCQEHVTDLRAKSRNEIKEELQKRNGKMCGQFYLDQLQNTSSPSRLSMHLTLFSIFSFLSFGGIKAQSAYSVRARTEQRSSEFVPDKEKRNEEALTCEVKESNGLIAAVSPPDDTKWRRQYLQIGHRQFFIGNTFPFFTTRRMRMGRIASGVKF